MKSVELPDDIADFLMDIPPEKRGDSLKRHGLKIPVLHVEESFSDQRKAVDIYSDGASRGNPGPSGAGFAIMDSGGKIIMKGKKPLGITTNNVAEWSALLSALENAVTLGATSVRCFLDSELVVKQMKGVYRIKHPDLKPLSEKVKILASRFQKISFHHIPREENTLADLLSNEAIDEA